MKHKLLSRQLSVPEKHQLRIAIQTMKAPDAMVGVMGGMDKKEAEAFLKRLGYYWDDEGYMAGKSGLRRISSKKEAGPLRKTLLPAALMGLSLAPGTGAVPQHKDDDPQNKSRIVIEQPVEPEKAGPRGGGHTMAPGYLLKHENDFDPNIITPEQMKEKGVLKGKPDQIMRANLLKKADTSTKVYGKPTPSNPVPGMVPPPTPQGIQKRLDEGKKEEEAMQSGKPLPGQPGYQPEPTPTPQQQYQQEIQSSKAALLHKADYDSSIRCPKCKSSDVDQSVFLKPNVRCNECKHSWNPKAKKAEFGENVFPPEPPPEQKTQGEQMDEDHLYCPRCKECVTCNLRTCHGGGEHLPGVPLSRKWEAEQHDWKRAHKAHLLRKQK